MGSFIFKWGCTPWGQGIGFDWGEGVQKNHRMGGGCPSTMGNPEGDT